MNWIVKAVKVILFVNKRFDVIYIISSFYSNYYVYKCAIIDKSLYRINRRL